MAGLALPEPPSDSEELIVELDRDVVREAAAKLYGAGIPRAKIARAMVNHLAPNRDRPLEQRLSAARGKLKSWEMSQQFRDMVYTLAVVRLDMATPEIFNALVKSSKKGRVDASRLVLELTGRHNPKGDTTPTQVIVAINGVPRPTQADYVVDRARNDAARIESGEVEL